MKKRIFLCIIGLVVAIPAGKILADRQSEKTLHFVGYNEMMVTNEVAVNLKPMMLSRTIAQKIAFDPRLSWASSEKNKEKLIVKFFSAVDVVVRGPVVTIIAKGRSEGEVRSLLDVVEEVSQKAAADIALERSRVLRAAIDRMQDYLKSKSLVTGRTKVEDLESLKFSDLAGGYLESMRFSRGVEMLLYNTYAASALDAPESGVEVKRLLNSLEKIKAINTFSVQYTSLTKRELGDFQISEVPSSQKPYLFYIGVIFVLVLLILEAIQSLNLRSMGRALHKKR